VAAQAGAAARGGMAGGDNLYLTATDFVSRRAATLARAQADAGRAHGRERLMHRTMAMHALENGWACAHCRTACADSENAG
jgi:hypothetical protein